MRVIYSNDLASGEANNLGSVGEAIETHEPAQDLLIYRLVQC